MDLKPGDTLDVGEAAGVEEAQLGRGFTGGSGRWLQNMHAKAGQPWTRVSTLNVIGCHPPGNAFPGSEDWHFCGRAQARAGVQYCIEHHMWPGVKRAGKRRVNAIGGQALAALTGRQGILQWRGSPLPLLGDRRPSVMPVVHPASLMRSPKLVSVSVGDLRKHVVLPPEHYNLFPSLADVQRFDAEAFAFDFEWDRHGNITLCGLTDKFHSALVVPFQEPYISELRRIFESARVLIGHNIIGADLAHVERLGWHLRPDLRVEDTMLKQHLVQPDLPHGLDFVASVFTQMPFWKGKWRDETDEKHEAEDAGGQQWRTWDRADALPRQLGGYGGCLSAQEAFALYNARDTNAEFQINAPLEAMLQKWELRGVYENVSRPAAYICRWLGERGLRIDTSRLQGIRDRVDVEIAALEERLPDGLKPYTREVACNLPAPPGTYRSVTKSCKGTRKNPHEPCNAVFHEPGESACVLCGRIIRSGKLAFAKIVKGTRLERVAPYNSPPALETYVKAAGLAQVIDRKTGRATTGKAARGIWVQSHPEFATLGLLKAQTTVRTNFAKDSLLGIERMFFNLKVHGTSEGRLSASGQRKGVDLNPQNQPEDFRAIYVPDNADWGFVNIDISQGESWLTCWLAEDWARWEKLQDPYYDEHSELAQAIFGRDCSKAAIAADPSLKALRQVGKKTNHASSYGMGWKTYHQQMVTAGFTQYTAADAKYFLEQWARLNPGTVAWQRRTIELMKRQGFLRNPFGRVRWFTSSFANNEALAFLPASTLADCVLRMMIAHYPSRFQHELQALRVEAYEDLTPEWVMSLQVHDSLLLQGPWGGREDQVARSSRIMTQPWAELNGFRFRVDVKTSQESWGKC